MTRIIRLTESDLTRIVKRVIKEQESTSGEYVNDPDLKKIQSDITTLNGIISNFKSPYNVKSYWLNGGKRGNVSVVQLLESKKDTNGYKRTIFEIQLGQTKKPFSSGSQFSDASNNNVDTSKVKYPFVMMKSSNNENLTASISFIKPSEKGACKLVASDNVAELVSLLHNEAKVI